VAVLLLRGLPAVLAVRSLLEALRAGAKDVQCLGSFRSIGPAALSLRETSIEEAWVVGSLVICASVLVHGVTVTPLTELYERLF
jgi:sodium/hydrogen antiporter